MDFIRFLLVHLGMLETFIGEYSCIVPRTLAVMGLFLYFLFRVNGLYIWYLFSMVVYEYWL